MKINWKHVRAILLSLLAIPAWAGFVNIGGNGRVAHSGGGGGTVIFDCNTSNFFLTTTASSSPCAVGTFPENGTGRAPNGFNVYGSNGALVSVEGGVVYLTPSGDGGHTGTGLIYQQKVNVQAFTATWTFVANGKNIAFVLQNDTTDHYGLGFNGRDFSAGAGCEAGFFQAFDVDSPNNIFALELAQDMALTQADPWTFTYSSAMIYSYRQSPCIPEYTPSWSNPSPPQTVPTKISTSPVPLNSPANSPLTTTGHTYSATLTYDGSNVKFDLYDITAGGSCPGASCFSKTWSSVNIPSLVGDTTAWVGMTGGCNSDCPARLNVRSFKYTVN